MLPATAPGGNATLAGLTASGQCAADGIVGFRRIGSVGRRHSVPIRTGDSVLTGRKNVLNVKGRGWPAGWPLTHHPDDKSQEKTRCENEAQTCDAGEPPFPRAAVAELAAVPHAPTETLNPLATLRTKARLVHRFRSCPERGRSPEERTGLTCHGSRQRNDSAPGAHA